MGGRLWIVLAAVVLTACASAVPAPSPQASPNPTATPSSPITPTQSPAPSPAATPSGQGAACWPIRGGESFRDKTIRPAITDARVGSHGTYDRLVVEFTEIGLPSYELRPAGGTTFIEDASGRSVTVEGSFGLGLRIFDTDWTSDRFRSGADLVPRFKALKEVRVVGDFEAIARIGIGLSAEVCPTVTQLSGPPRLVIDFPTGG